MLSATTRKVLTVELALEVQAALGWDPSQKLRGTQVTYMHGQLVQASINQLPCPCSLALLPLHSHIPWLARSIPTSPTATALVTTLRP